MRAWGTKPPRTASGERPTTAAPTTSGSSADSPASPDAAVVSERVIGVRDELPSAPAAASASDG